MAFSGRGGDSSKVIPLQPTLTWQFQSGGNFSKVLPMQPIAVHSYMAFSGRGGNSPKCIPLQPIAAHSYMVILDRGMGKSSESSHCRPMEPNLHSSLSQRRVGGFLRSHPNAAHCIPLLHGSFSQGR